MCFLGLIFLLALALVMVEMATTVVSVRVEPSGTFLYVPCFFFL